MPVNLIGHQAGQKNELSMILLREAEQNNPTNSQRDTKTKNTRTKRKCSECLYS